jgi:hypothetical protein
VNTPRVSDAARGVPGPQASSTDARIPAEQVKELRREFRSRAKALRRELRQRAQKAGFPSDCAICDKRIRTGILILHRRPFGPQTGTYRSWAHRRCVEREVMVQLRRQIISSTIGERP